MIVAVSDAGPLIHLHESGALTLLLLFSTLHVPGEVWRETVGMQRIPEAALTDLGLQRHVLGHGALSDFVAAHRLEYLHTGEQE
ncbi:MAG TPA: hypothetical protein VIV60_13480, partial [Polyangiaceae bacterium]